MEYDKKLMEILNKVSDYYTDKVCKYGETAKGVDWRDESSQILRFVQISKIISQSPFSINDIGCGYGKYFEFLKNSFSDFDYIGYDISAEMIKRANKLYNPFGAFFIHINDLKEIRIADYCVASGIFNVKMDISESDWLNIYVLPMLEQMAQKSTLGFAFNMLTNYSDKDKMRTDLYYADPLFIFDYCKRNFSRNVALLHDYGLYEFTILVRKY